MSVKPPSTHSLLLTFEENIMDICAFNHVEIVHEEGDNYCPLCEANTEIEDLKQDIVNLEEEAKGE